MTAPGWPRPSAEARRLATLHGLGVLDQPQDAELDGLTRLASYICGTPTAVLNLIDSDRQWQASAYGAERGEVTRDESMCGYSILSRDVTYTPDASLDAVFAENPHVTGELLQHPALRRRAADRRGRPGGRHHLRVRARAVGS